jgi:diacylglycerol kinase
MKRSSFLKSFKYAYNGLLESLKDQRNLKVQVVIAIVVICAGLYFHITDIEWCIVLLFIGLVLSLEMVNTAFEMLVDLVTQEWKPLAGKIKDVAAGAVLVASFMAVIAGVIIFYKYCGL